MPCTFDLRETNNTKGWVIQRIHGTTKSLTYVMKDVVVVWKVEEWLTDGRNGAASGAADDVATEVAAAFTTLATTLDAI
jgi:hypothetical protein